MKPILALVALLIPAVTHAGHVRVACQSRYAVVRQKAVVLQQVYPYQYGVGASLEEEALAERIAQRVLAKLESSQRTQQPAVLSQGLVTRRCAKCHDGNHPKTDLNLSDLALLPCEEKLQAVHRVVSGTMPPDSEPPLSPDEAGQVLTELSQPQTQELVQ